MVRSALLRALLVLGIAVNVAFLLINLSPDRPHLRGRRRVKVLIKGSHQQARWIKENQLAEFGAQHDLDFEVVALPGFDRVYAALKRAKEEHTGLILSGLDEEYAGDAIADGLVVPIEDLLEERVGDVAERYLPEAIARASFDRKLWFLPKRGSMDVVAFLKPALEDAYLHWHGDRAAIEAALREANGQGLPAGYELERSANQWDDYDLFVAGWYWAHHPAPWAKTRVNGADLVGPAPRLARRSGDSDEAMHDLVSSFYRHGLHARELGQPDAPAVLDALQWEALFHKHGLLAPECDSVIGCDGDSVAALVASRRLAYAPIDQSASLWVHGGARKEAAWSMEGASDLGWAMRPAGASLELKDGKPARSSRTHSFLEVTFWAVPVDAPDKALAAELALFLTQRGLQQREAEALGMLPMRRDLKDQYPIYFRLDWMQQLLDASYKQAYFGSGEVPSELIDKEYGALYSKLRDDVVSSRPRAEVPVTLAAVREAVRQASPKRDEVTRAR